jgi:mono/diheme cytochrome c family protein
MVCGMVPQQLDAGCRVAVGQTFNTGFAYTTAFVPAGIGVAAVAPYQYAYNPPPTVNVVVDTNSIASAVVQQLTSQMNAVNQPSARAAQPADRPPPPVPGPAANQPAQPGPAANGPPQADVFAETGEFAKCVQCHSPTGKKKSAFAKLDLSAVTTLASLAPDKRLLVIDRITSDDPAAMMPPPGEPRLSPEELGSLIHRLSHK